jgi:hypothetical protein
MFPEMCVHARAAPSTVRLAQQAGKMCGDFTIASQSLPL